MASSDKAPNTFPAAPPAPRKLRAWNPLVLLGAALMLPACDTLVEYRFVLVNNSAQSLQVHVVTPQKDSVLDVAPAAQAILLERSQVNSGVKPYFKDQDTIWWFSSLEVMRLSDSASPNKVLRLASNWTFTEGEDKHGVYQLDLGDGDF